MRLASGMASPAEVEHYRTQSAAPPPPSPLPPPPTHPPQMPYVPNPAQQHFAPNAQPLIPHAPLRLQPYPPPFPQAPHGFPGHPPNAQFPHPSQLRPAAFAEANKAFSAGYPGTSEEFSAGYPSGAQQVPGQYNGFAPQPHVEDMRHTHHQPHAQHPVNPQMHSRFGPPTSVPFDRYQPAHHIHPPHPPVEPFRPDFNRDATPPNSTNNDPHTNPSSPRFDSDKHIPLFQFRNPRNPSFPYQNLDHSANQAEKPYAKGKRSREDYSANGSGRYWAKQDGTKPFKRSKPEKGFNGNKQKHGKSRFAVLTSNDNVRPRLPRPAPLPIEAESVIPTCRKGNFGPTSKYAKSLLKASVDVVDSSKLARIYSRDFKPSTSENGSSPCSVRTANGDDEYSFEAVVGTCEKIEKVFLRLTSAPKPSAVRPPHVLTQSLAHIKNMWREGRKNYDWVCKQLKSVRQDYKVQHIENTAVADVYETHARIALEQSDLGEFNTCVAQVQALYEKVKRSEQLQDEFASYRILYNLLVGASEWEQGKILAKFSDVERTRKATRFALHIRQAVVSGNYNSYFKFSRNPPSKTMISYLLVHFHERVRLRAISTMVSAYGPGNLPVSFVFNQLGWGSEDASSDTTGADLKQALRGKAADSGLLYEFNSLNLDRQPAHSLKAMTFLLDIGAVLTVEDSEKPEIERLLLDCKSTKASGIRKPEGSKKLITHAGAEQS